MVHHYDGCEFVRLVKTAGHNYANRFFYGVWYNGTWITPYMRVPVNTLVNLPDQLTFEEGAAISCGTGTAFGLSKDERV